MLDDLFNIANVNALILMSIEKKSNIRKCQSTPNEEITFNIKLLLIRNKLINIFLHLSVV